MFLKSDHVHQAAVVMFFQIRCLILVPWVNLLPSEHSLKKQMIVHHLSPVSTHPSLHQHPHLHTQEMLVGQFIWAVSRGFPGMPYPPLCLVFATAAANCACWPRFCISYAFHLLILQCHLTKLKSGNLQILLSDSTGFEQWPRIQVHLSTNQKYIYNIDVYRRRCYDILKNQKISPAINFGYFR